MGKEFQFDDHQPGDLQSSSIVNRHYSSPPWSWNRHGGWVPEIKYGPLKIKRQSCYCLSNGLFVMFIQIFMFLFSLMGRFLNGKKDAFFIVLPNICHKHFYEWMIPDYNKSYCDRTTFFSFSFFFKQTPNFMYLPSWFIAVTV